MMLLGIVIEPSSTVMWYKSWMFLVIDLVAIRMRLGSFFYIANAIFCGAVVKGDCNDLTRYFEVSICCDCLCRTGGS